MKKKWKTIIILTSIILPAFFFGFGEFLTSKSSDYSDNNDHQNNEFIIPKISDPLHYSAIQRNATTIYRLFESINFTIDTTDISNTNYTIMQISFSNGSLRNYNMASVGVNEFYYEYKPEYNAPLGFQNVSFLLYNVIGTLLNDHTTYTNFTIVTNYMLNLDKSDYYLGDTLYGELIVSNFSTYDFQWNITVVDSVDELTQNNTLNLENNAVQFTIEIDNNTFTQVEKTYFIKLNISDKITQKKGAAYFPFNVRNSIPNITSNIDLSPEEVFRTDDCTISLNVTDLETAPEDLTITLKVYDAQGTLVVQKSITHDGGTSYSDTFNIAWNRPTGEYRINVIARDEHGGESSKETFLTVKNNLPEIHNYWINGLSGDVSISVRYGENLIFSFNVSDVEGVSYLKVALLNENNEWYNITRTYDGDNTVITVRTAELITGIWFVYIYVIDSDGVVISLIDDYGKAPQGISIIPDVLSDYLPWILFFMGLSLGALLGIGSIRKYYKSKFGEPEAISPEKKKVIPKKAPFKKKEKAKLIEEELKEREIEEIKPKKEEEKEAVPKRKIKRKL